MMTVEDHITKELEREETQISKLMNRSGMPSGISISPMKSRIPGSAAMSSSAYSEDFTTEHQDNEFEQLIDDTERAIPTSEGDDSAFPSSSSVLDTKIIDRKRYHQVVPI
jgi:hypothetical protein